MTDPEKPKASGPPESPTTAREVDFEDELLETSPAVESHPAGTRTNVSSTYSEDVPPPQPPRPLSARQQAENTLKEAFPNIDAAIVKAVLTASGGQVEPAFNALLGMSDPESQKEPTPPPQPPRPIHSPIGPTSTARTQLEADELYARQLAEHYGGSETYGGGQRSGSRGRREQPVPRPKKDTGLKPNELYDDRDHSFFDDDLPVIREQFKKGFQETQSKVNSFITSLRKKIDGEEEEDFQSPPPRTATGFNGTSQQQTYGGRRSGDLDRRSAERDRYDADPQVLGDDFTNLNVRDDAASQRRSTRPLANPDLFKPTPPPPQTSNRRVSFQDGPPEQIDDLYRSSPDPTKRPTSGAGRSKWQPLAAVDPSPVADHDPFSLGDSDDEDVKKTDLKVDDTERLKKAAAETVEDDISSPGKKVLEPQPKVGPAETRDKEAEEMLTGKS